VGSLRTKTLFHAESHSKRKRKKKKEKKTKKKMNIFNLDKKTFINQAKLLENIKKKEEEGENKLVKS
jgi:hypothetical protein